MLGEEHALVDQRAAGERADVELADVLADRRLLHAAAQDIELLLELAVVELGIAAAEQDLGLDDDAAALLRIEIGARQEHGADGDAARHLLARGFADMVAEEILRDLDMDAR